MSQLFYNDTEHKVLDVKTKHKKQELVILRDKRNPFQHEVVRGQAVHVKNQLKRKQDQMEVVGSISSYKNPVSLYNRFGEWTKKNGQNQFKKTGNKIVVKEGYSSDDLMNTFQTLDEKKHEMALKVKALL